MIQTTQHVITCDQLNTTGAEIGPAQPQLVFIFNMFPSKKRLTNVRFQEHMRTFLNFEATKM